MKRLGLLGGMVVLLGLLLYIPFVHHADSHEIGLMYDAMTGEVRLDGHSGFHLSAPWVAVAKIDTRPQRVCIASVAKIATCKLARFVSAGHMQFVQREGFRYYWWDNRISFNMGHRDEYRGVPNLIRGYAFSGVGQEFIEVLSDLHE